MTWLLLGSLAFAQVVHTDRPVMPSAGLAAEGGPGMFWVNPAHMAYDPDLRYGVYLGQDLGGANTSIAVTAGIGGLSVGVHNLIRPDGAADWSLDYATSIPLPERLAVGFRVDWHLVEGGRNYVGYDVGAAWRPLPWFGAAAVARNIGNPDDAAVATSGFGLAFRPFDDLLVIGGDYLKSFPPDGSDLPENEAYTATVRLRPVRGLYLRGSVDSDLRVGAGLEVYFGGVGGGAYGVTGDERLGLITWIGTDEPGETLIRSGRRVTAVDLREVPPYQPSNGLFEKPKPSWLDILELLRRIEDDRGIRGVALTLSGDPMSWARAQELRQRIEHLESLDKRVVVYLHGSPGNTAYYVASAASRVIIHPAAQVDLIGISTDLLHVRGALDLVGVRPQYARRSEYKSAPEQLTDTEPSPFELEQTEALIDDQFTELVDGLVTGRGVSEDDAVAWIDGGPYPAAEALKRGLVDAIAYPDDLDRELFEVHSGPVKVTRLEDTPQPRSAWVAPSQIAVIYVDAVITSGKSSDGGLIGQPTSGSRTIARMLDRARQDPQVKAVVLRLDTPGGSSFGSDVIWHAMQRVREDGKPVVVSMGAVAASGGYWIATAADSVWAEPSTITGSIGVFSGKMDYGELMDRLGITATTLSRGRHAGMWSPSRGWDPVERERAQALVDDVYVRFTDKVVAGRGLSEDRVEEVARGRIWSGRRAHELGLVDGLGGLQHAIQDARSRAGISAKRRVALVTYEPDGSVLSSLSPTLLRMMGPIPAVARALRRDRTPDPLFPPQLSQAWAPLWVGAALADDRVWALEPRLLGSQDR